MKLLKIRPDNDLLNLEAVNCLEIAIGYCLKKWGTEYQNYFLLYLKCLQSYKIRDFNKPDIFYPVNLNPYIKTILDKLNIKIVYNNQVMNAQGMDALTFIKTAIDGQNPVFVSGNLKELYYSVNYQVRDSRHVFLINGYDEERNLYYTIDNNQNPGFEYTQFCLEEPVLMKLMDSCRQTYNPSYVGKLEKEEEYFRKEDILREVLSFLILPDTGLWEMEFIQGRKTEIQSCIPYDTSWEDCFIRCTKHKDLFYRTLKTILKKEYPNAVDYETVDALHKRIITEWKQIVNGCLLSRYKQETFTGKKEILQAIILENEMKQQIGRIYNNMGGRL